MLLKDQILTFLPEKCLEVICLDTDQCPTTNASRDAFKHGTKSVWVWEVEHIHRLLRVYVVWFQFFLVKKFTNQFHFCFPLSQMMVMDQKQKKANIKLVWKFLTPQKIGITAHTLFITNFLVDTIAKTLQQSVNEFWLAQSYHPDYTQDLWYF